VATYDPFFLHVLPTTYLVVHTSNQQTSNLHNPRFKIYTKYLVLNEKFMMAMNQLN